MAFNFLIVDDSKVVRAVIEKTLRMTDLPVGTIFTAGNGQEALDVLAKEWVDLVFADINMPVMNGQEMIRRMSQNDVTKAIPIVVVSTEGSTTRMEELEACGIKAYLRKPFQPEQFATTVNEILGGAHAKHE